MLMALSRGTPAAERAAPKDALPGDQIIPPPLKDLGRNYKLRLAYFVPTDCEVKPKYREKTEVLLRVVADVFRRELQANGHTSRGPDFEFDKHGRLKVHLVKGKHPAAFYRGNPPSVDHLFRSQQQEIMEGNGRHWGQRVATMADDSATEGKRGQFRAEKNKGEQRNTMESK